MSETIREEVNKFKLVRKEERERSVTAHGTCLTGWAFDRILVIVDKKDEALDEALSLLEELSSKKYLTERAL